MSNDRRTVKSFVGGEVTLQGPLCLQLHICGVTIVQPFYTIDDETPIIVGFDSLVAARTIIDPYRRLAYSHFNYIGHSPEPLSMTQPHAKPPFAFRLVHKLLCQPSAYLMQARRIACRARQHTTQLTETPRWLSDRSLPVDLMDDSQRTYSVCFFRLGRPSRARQFVVYRNLRTWRH